MGSSHSFKFLSQHQLWPPASGAPPQPWSHYPAYTCPSLHNALLEVASEGIALIALDLPVLDSPPLQVVIHLRGINGSGALLILGRGLANPVVNVIGQVAARLVDLGRGGIQCT